MEEPEKTEGKYISAYECDPGHGGGRISSCQSQLQGRNGDGSRKRKRTYSVTRYAWPSIPGRITPKEANRIGYELAMRWTKGRHAFLVTTHTDKKHIHCHIYYNSTSLDCSRKFRNFWGSSLRPPAAL